VTEPPAQNVVGPEAVIVGVAALFTVSVCESVYVQPTVLVMVAVSVTGLAVAMNHTRLSSVRVIVPLVMLQA
jgi:hypothetical protein